jgi:hypothetical protein
MNECGICLEIIEESTVLVCTHSFCTGCIHQWIIEKGFDQSCPCCRTGITQEEINNSYKWGLKSNYIFECNLVTYKSHEEDKPYLLSKVNLNYLIKDIKKIKKNFKKDKKDYIFKILKVKSVTVLTKYFPDKPRKLYRFK